MNGFLREIPLYNTLSAELPNEIDKQIFPDLQLPEKMTDSKHFQIWYDECDLMINMIHKNESLKHDFDEWYDITFLKRQPPGLLDATIPKKKK